MQQDPERSTHSVGSPLVDAPSDDSSALVARDSAELVRLRRDDVAALAAGSRIRARSSQFVGAVPPASGLLTFFALIGLQEVGGIVALTTPLCIAGGVAMFAAVTARLWRAERARRAAYSLACPNCGLQIVSGQPFDDDSQRSALVVASGCCPGCGVRIVAD